MVNPVAIVRQGIARGMARVPAWAIVTVDNTTLYQSNTSPFELADTGNDGHYARVRKLSDTQSLAVQGATIGAQLWEVQTLGDKGSTPNMAALMDTQKTWQIQFGQDANPINARVISLSPSEMGVGWKATLEVMAL